MTNGQKQTKLVAFTKPFTNKLKDATLIKGKGVMFMHKDIYDRITKSNKVVESERSTDQ